MTTWYVRLAIFEHYRIEADTPEAAAARAGRASEAATAAGRAGDGGFVMSEDLGFDVSATDGDGDPIGEAVVMGGEYPPEEITGPPA